MAASGWEPGLKDGHRSVYSFMVRIEIRVREPLRRSVELAAWADAMRKAALPE